jgi:hypothetical protein
MTRFGVRRLVAINSGNYSYASLDLSQPVHLAAPNNRGKSTLVNALQFLYVDDFNRMKFGRRSHEDTRRHYFGEDRSYLVFECRTTSGVKCLLVRGLSKLRGGDFERYVFDGEFLEADFLDDGSVRPFDEVRACLAGRQLARVRNSQLWQVLAGNRQQEDGRAIPRLNILPIRRREEYLAFRDVFIRLLSLGHADARTLRQLVVESHSRDVGQRKIDVAADYKEEFDRAERSEQELNFLRAVAAEIDQGRALRREIQSMCESFASRAILALDGARRCHQLMQAECERLVDEQLRLAADRKAADIRRKASVQAAMRLGADLLVLERERDQLSAAREKWSAYSTELVSEMRAGAERKLAEISELERNLEVSAQLDLAAMQRRVEQLRRQIAADRQAYERWERTAAAQLRRAGLDDRQIDAAFRIANPALLRLIVGETLEIKDADAVVEAIRALAAQVHHGRYTGSSVEADVSGVPGPDSQTLADRESLRQQIRVNELELAQQESRLRVAEDEQTARAVLAGLKQEYGRLGRELAEWDEYSRAWARRAELERRLDAARRAVEAGQGEVSQLEELVKSCARSERRIQQELGAWTARQRELSLAVQTLREEAQRRMPGPADDPRSGPANYLDEADGTRSVPADGEDSPGPLPELVESAVQRLSALARELRHVESLRARFKECQESIAAHSRQFETQQRYFLDEDEEWRLLIEAREALPELEEVARRNWDALLTTLQARLMAMVIAVRNIKTAVDRINRGLTAYRVSNLREVQIRVEEQHDLFPAVEALASQRALHQDRDANETARRRLRQMIDRHDTIELDSLFELRIHIQEPDGTSHEAASLDEIGSTGTGMTAKVMIFIQLVRAIAADEAYRLHFYIDGLGELDDRNLEATASMAVSRGFIPITADPRLHLEPLAHPEVTVYSLGQSPDGRFFIDRYRTYHARRQLGSVEAPR